MLLLYGVGYPCCCERAVALHLTYNSEVLQAGVAQEGDARIGCRPKQDCRTGRFRLAETKQNIAILKSTYKK